MGCRQACLQALRNGLWPAAALVKQRLHFGKTSTSNLSMQHSQQLMLAARGLASPLGWWGLQATALLESSCKTGSAIQQVCHIATRADSADPSSTSAHVQQATSNIRTLLAQPHGSPLGWAASTHPQASPSHVQVRGMFIQTQPTPNPHSLMFMPGQKVMESGSREFPNARAGMASPLAKRLFAIDGVTGVFFGAEFITVTKQEDVSWAALKPQIFGAVMDHFASGEPLLLEGEALAASDTAIHEDDDEVVAMIKELLETRIRPAVQEDGGDITYRGFDPDSGLVTVKMMGACSGCPSSTVTLKSGIENMLMHYIPEVKGVVEAGPDEFEEEGLKEFQKLDSQLEKEESANDDEGGEAQKEQSKDSPMAEFLSN